MARVLVVDDEPDLRELLRVSLTMVGHHVSVAPDGPGGLDLAVRERPQAIVLDVMMPGMDGWTVLASLKAHANPEVSSIPVLMLTARADDLDVVRGGIEGAVRYLTKPFAIKDLRAAVDQAVAGGPEAEQRQAAQRAALTQLARLEKGVGVPSGTVPRPRMSQLEPVSTLRRAEEAKLVQPLWPSWLSSSLLTGRDHQVLDVLVSSKTMTEARQRLEVSRSYLYSSLRHIAAKLDFESGPALLQALRTAQAVRERGSRPGPSSR